MLQLMKKTVSYLDAHRWARAPFFWSSFPVLGLAFPVQYLLLRELMDCDSVLDLGCGRHSMVPILPKRIRTVGVELFEPHYQEAVAKGRHTEYIREDVTKVSFPDRSFDAVVLLDVIEHLPAEEGQALLDRMTRWARKKVVVFTPNGFLHQDEYDENPLMAHQSGWEVADFRQRGFRIYGVRGFRKWKKESFEHDHEKPSALGNLMDLTQLWTYYHPEQAFQLFCVKTIDA